jgi:hypothetical protein
MEIAFPTSKNQACIRTVDGKIDVIPLHRLDSTRKSPHELDTSIAYYIMGWKIDPITNQWIDSVSGLSVGYSVSSAHNGDDEKHTKPAWSPTSNVGQAITAAREFNQRRFRMRCDNEEVGSGAAAAYPIPLIYSIGPYSITFTTHADFIFSILVDTATSSKDQIPFRFCQGLLFSRKSIEKLSSQSQSVTNTADRCIFFELDVTEVQKMQRKHSKLDADADNAENAPETTRDLLRHNALKHVLTFTPLALLAEPKFMHLEQKNHLAGPWYSSPGSGDNRCASNFLLEGCKDANDNKRPSEDQQEESSESRKDQCLSASGQK